MTYKTHREQLKKLMHSYVICMLDSQNPDDTKKLSAELQRIKDEIQFIDGMTESQIYEQRKTLNLIIESRMKFT